MLRLPAALVEDISLRSGALSALSLTCRALFRVLNQPETQLRFYLTAQRHRYLTNGCISVDTPCSSSSSQSSTDPAAGRGPATVYGLLSCRARPKDAQGTLRLLQLMLTCSSMVHLVPDAQQDAVQHMLAATSSSDAPRAIELLLKVLPYAEHCLLQFSAASGHLQLVKHLLPRCIAPVKLHGVLHYVKTGAFLAAAAGGHVCVLSELLSAGASHWACQLSGASLTCSALDLAALGGHMEAMQLLSHHVANPSPYFLTAAADSGSGSAMEWALQHWFAQFSALTAFSKAHALQMHDALKVSCQRGHVSAVRQLLAALHRTSNDDCCVLALTYASSTSNTAAIQAVLDSPQLPAQLARGPKVLSMMAQAVASCIRIAILKHCRPALDTLLQALTSSSSPISAARPLLAPHMRFIFDQAAQSGNGTALQLLLLSLPEHYEALGVSALEAALSEGHADVAATIKTLLIMQGPDQGSAAAALSPEGNPGLAKASLHGAYKGACVRGDIPALQSLLQQGPDGPDDNMQLLLLRLAAGAGKEEAVRLLLAEFGNVGPRLEANLKAVCRGAVHAGQLQLLQSLAADGPQSALLAHIASQPEALAEYLRAALLCDQVDVAAWLVLLAHEQHEMELVRSTLSSLLATSRWELLNAGRGIVMHEVVFDLLKRLAAHFLAASSSGSSDRRERCSDSSTGSTMRVSDSSSPAELQLPQLAASPAAAAAATGADDSVSTGVADGSSDDAHGTDRAARLASLGRELLQPQLLGQLLHVSQGLSPWRLLAVVQLVDWWGLGGTTQQEQQVESPVAAQQLAGEPVPAVTQQQQQAAATFASASAAAVEQQEVQAQRQSSSDDSAALRDNAIVPRSSSGASLSSEDNSGNDDSSVTSSSSGSGDAACDVLSPCDTVQGVGPTADTPTSTRRLLPANSMEVGSLQSDDCQPTSTWLDDLVHKGSKVGGSSAGGSSCAGTAAAAPADAHPQGQQQEQGQTAPQQAVQQQQQLQQQGRRSLQLHVQHPIHCALGEAKHLDLGKEWGGSWQQLTGQVAQLHMTSPGRLQQPEAQLCSPTHPSAPTARKPRCSFDYEQHVAQQLRRRQQQQLGGDDQIRRDSSPGPNTTAVAAARQLRASLSQAATTRCPVHPYMQQCGQQHQHGA